MVVKHHSIENEESEGRAGVERSEPGGRAQLNAGARRRAGDPPDRPWLPTGLVDAAVDRAAGRRRVRQALRVPSDRRISDAAIDELLAGASTEEEIAGPGGLLAELTKRLVERAMEVERSEHAGYEPHCEPPGVPRTRATARPPRRCSPNVECHEGGRAEGGPPRRLRLSACEPA